VLLKIAVKAEERLLHSIVGIRWVYPDADQIPAQGGGKLVKPVQRLFARPVRRPSREPCKGLFGRHEAEFHDPAVRTTPQTQDYFISADLFFGFRPATGADSPVRALSVCRDLLVFWLNVLCRLNVTGLEISHRYEELP
jgi:hypothetical protein